MLSSTNSTKRSFFGAFGPAAGVAVFCMALGTGAYAQDECSSAVTAVVGANAFSTATATASTDAVSDAQCADTYLNWLATQQDVWFVFNPGTQGTANFSTCLAGSYDTSMAIYSGANCAGKTQIACNGDDDVDASCQNYHSEINGLLIDGSSNYYIRLGGYNGATGSGTLTVAFTPVAFASCIGNTHPCDEVGGTGGCDNLTCCETVCGFFSDCCDIEWSQDCIDLAVSECGLFIYSCPAAGGAPANNCAANATVVTTSTTLAYDTTNATTDGPNEPDCNSGNSDLPIWKDVWYRFTAGANGFATASNCNTGTFDSKIAFYDVGDWSQFNPQLLPDYFMACNEDCDGDPLFNSSQTVAVQIGRTYLVRLGGFEGANGSGNISITLPDPCVLPAASASEGEPCGDSTNPGCADDEVTVQTTPLALNTKTAGTFWADADFRDVDWYSFTITQSSEVTANLFSGSPGIVFIFSGDPCTGLAQIAEAGATFCPQSATACLSPGNYLLAVAIDGFSGTPCGSGTFNDYVVEVVTAPSLCPATVSAAACVDPGANSATVNSNLTTGAGIVACAVAGAAGGTTVNSYARVFTAGTVTGELTCLQLGLWSVKVAANGNFASDRPLPATIGIYRDLDGGAPRFKTADGGVDGGDLDLIWTRAVLVPGGAYLASFNFDENEGGPLCLEDYSSYNLVVIADFPNLLDGSTGIPANSGYQMRVSGPAVTGQGSLTYCRLSCADAAGQYVLCESLGGTFINQWVVVANGNFGSCGAACVYDIAGADLVVNGADLGALLANWGNPGVGDFDGSGAVNGADLGELLANWGACPN
jgi:hypothetical protein